MSEHQAFSPEGTKRALLVILALAAVSALVNRSRNEHGSATGRQTPSSAKVTTSIASASESFTLSDGSQLTIHNIRPADKWECGLKKTGQLEVGSSRLRVVLYFKPNGDLFSVNSLQAGNERLYDNSQGRECLMNWKTRTHELLTQEEYKRLEKEAGV